jgi:hypothetical protein
MLLNVFYLHTILFDFNSPTTTACGTTVFIACQLKRAGQRHRSCAASHPPLGRRVSPTTHVLTMYDTCVLL